MITLKKYVLKIQLNTQKITSIYTEYKENIERKMNDTVEPSELIFNSNNYNTPQTVTINSSKDNNKIEDTAVIKINSNYISEKQLTVTITDKGPETTV